MAGYFSRAWVYFRGWAGVLLLASVAFWGGVTVHMYLTMHADASRGWKSDLSFGIACDVGAVKGEARKYCVTTDEVIDRHEAVRKELFWKAMKYSLVVTGIVWLLGGLLYFPVWLIRRRWR